MCYKHKKFPLGMLKVHPAWAFSSREGSEIIWYRRINLNILQSFVNAEKPFYIKA